MTTKIHVLVDALGNPVEVMLSPGQDHDLTCAESLIEAVDPGAVIADKAFDADAFIDALNARAIAPVIPSKSNRKTPRPCDFALYCERNLIERFFNKLKHFRAIATRYDKLAKIFLAGVQLACAAILRAAIRQARSPPHDRERITMPRRRTTKEARNLSRDLDLAESRARPAAPRLYGVHMFDRPADERLSLVEALAICLDNRSAKPTIVTMVALTKKLPQ